jgi:hypothetical protein
VRNTLASVVDACARLNTVIERDGVFRKKRAWWAPLVIAGGEVFLALSDGRIRMPPRPSTWRAWEVRCSRLLGGDAWTEGGWLCTRRVAGRALRERERVGALTLADIAAGARAMKRAHSVTCDWYGGPWSHGDPHLGNIVVDDEGGGTLIDFETRHVRSLDAAGRHGDDLATMLLDLAGLADEPFERARAAIDAYAPGGNVARALRERLVVRRGLPGVLVATRTHHMPVRALEARLERIRTLCG